VGRWWGAAASKGRQGGPGGVPPGKIPRAIAKPTDKSAKIGRRRVATGANHPASHSSAFRRGPGTPAGAPTGDQSTAMHVTPKPPLVRQDRISRRSRRRPPAVPLFSRFRASFQGLFPGKTAGWTAPRQVALAAAGFPLATPLPRGARSALAGAARRPESREYLRARGHRWRAPRQNRGWR